LSNCKHSFGGDRDTILNNHTWMADFYNDAVNDKMCGNLLCPIFESVSDVIEC